MSERTLRRWREHFEAEGEEGLLDRRFGRRPGRAVPDVAAAEIERLYRERYQGFTAKHFHEHLVRGHGFSWGYAWTKTYLQQRGFTRKVPQRGAHRHDAAAGRFASRLALGTGPARSRGHIRRRGLASKKWRVFLG